MATNGGCLISDTAKRGITLPQLRLIEQHLQKRLDAGEELMVSRPKGDDWIQERVTQVDMLNLYDINALVILPATMGRTCSMVEIMAVEAQCPDYFVSHWSARVRVVTVDPHPSLGDSSATV